MRLVPTLVGLAFLGGCSGGAGPAVEGPPVVRGVARQYSWQFWYPAGPKVSELHVTVGQTVELRIESGDVLHTLYVPGLGVKTDIVPGRETSVRITAREVGTLKLACADYCGPGWSGHTSIVIVHPAMEPGELRPP